MQSVQQGVVKSRVGTCFLLYGCCGLCVRVMCSQLILVACCALCVCVCSCGSRSVSHAEHTSKFVEQVAAWRNGISDGRYYDFSFADLKQSGAIDDSCVMCYRRRFDVTINDDGEAGLLQQELFDRWTCVYLTKLCGYPISVGHNSSVGEQEHSRTVTFTLDAYVLRADLAAVNDAADAVVAESVGSRRVSAQSSCELAGPGLGPK